MRTPSKPRDAADSDRPRLEKIAREGWISDVADVVALARRFAKMAGRPADTNSKGPQQ